MADVAPNPNEAWKALSLGRAWRLPCLLAQLSPCALFRTRGDREHMQGTMLPLHQALPNGSTLFYLITVYHENVHHIFVLRCISGRRQHPHPRPFA